MPDTEVAPTDVTEQPTPSCLVCGNHNVISLEMPTVEGETNYFCQYHRIICNDCHYCEPTLTGNTPHGWLLTNTTVTGYLFDHPICPHCAGGYGQCDDCGDILHHEDLHIFDGNSYCSEHISRYLPSDNEEDDEEDDESDDRSELVINEYHSSRHVVQRVSSPWTRSNNRYIGVELEVEQISGYRNESAHAILSSVANVVAEITTDKYSNYRLLWAEQDGSLNNGFELITAPLGLDDQRNLWTHILTPTRNMIKGLRSHNTTTCGLHVHISRNKLTQLQIAKIVAFVNNDGNYGFIKQLARRYGTHFCKAKYIPLCNGAKNHDQDRYEMVNLCNSSTIEFRIFRGTLKLESLLACVEFANALVAYADCGSGTGMDITAARFRRFIAEPAMRADTVYLRSYLASVVPATDTE